MGGVGGGVSGGVGGVSGGVSGVGGGEGGVSDGVGGGVSGEGPFAAGPYCPRMCPQICVKRHNAGSVGRAPDCLVSRNAEGRTMKRRSYRRLVKLVGLREAERLIAVPKRLFLLLTAWG